MQVKVSFLGKVQEYSSGENLALDLPDTTDVDTLFKEIIKQKPRLKGIAKFLFVSVNGVMAARNRELLDGDEVALFFRMGGG